MATDSSDPETASDWSDLDHSPIPVEAMDEIPDEASFHMGQTTSERSVALYEEPSGKAYLAETVGEGVQRTESFEHGLIAAREMEEWVKGERPDDFPIVGATIEAVKPLAEVPGRRRWRHQDTTPALVLDNGVRLFPSKDHEGNNSGALFLEHPDEPDDWEFIKPGDDPEAHTLVGQTIEGQEGQMWGEREAVSTLELANGATLLPSSAPTKEGAGYLFGRGENGHEFVLAAPLQPEEVTGKNEAVGTFAEGRLDTMDNALTVTGANTKGERIGTVVETVIYKGTDITPAPSSDKLPIDLEGLEFRLGDGELDLRVPQE